MENDVKRIAAKVFGQERQGQSATPSARSKRDFGFVGRVRAGVVKDEPMPPWMKKLSDDLAPPPPEESKKDSFARKYGIRGDEAVVSAEVLTDLIARKPVDVKKLVSKGVSKIISAGESSVVLYLGGDQISPENLVKVPAISLRDIMILGAYRALKGADKGYIQLGAQAGFRRVILAKEGGQLPLDQLQEQDGLIDSKIKDRRLQETRRYILQSASGSNYYSENEDLDIKKILKGTTKLSLVPEFHSAKGVAVTSKIVLQGVAFNVFCARLKPYDPDPLTHSPRHLDNGVFLRCLRYLRNNEIKKLSDVTAALFSDEPNGIVLYCPNIAGNNYVLATKFEPDNV